MTNPAAVLIHASDQIDIFFISDNIF